MRILMFASAAPDVVKKAIKEFADSDLTVLVTSNNYDAYAELFGTTVIFVRVSTNSFDNVPENDLRNVTGEKYDAVIIVSGGLGFIAFSNVLTEAAKFNFRQVIFYNKIGRKEIVRVKRGIGRVVENCFVTAALRFFNIARRIELLVERGYIRCAELLGL